MIKIQVKTLTGRAPVPLGKSLNSVDGDFWIIVNNVRNRPSSFILVPEEIRNRAHKGEKNGKVSYWLQPKLYEVSEFREAWQRLGEP